MRPFDDAAPLRTIVGFTQDEEDHWVALLSCGHRQHVRHDPPMQNRPWVSSPDGRESRLGAPLHCMVCLTEADAREAAAPVLDTIDGAALGALLAHRFPFLLVDRIEILEPGRRVVGRKRITGGEWWSEGSAGRAVRFPTSLVIEAMAQTSAGLMRDLPDVPPGAVAYFMGMSRVRLRGEAAPGDELIMSLTLRQWRRGLCRAHGVATVGDRLVASAALTTIIRSA